MAADGKTPLMIAVMTLDQHDTNMSESPCSDADVKNSLTIINDLLSRGAEVNATTERTGVPHCTTYHYFEHLYTLLYPRPL